MAGALRAPPPLGLDAALGAALAPLTNRMNGMQGQMNGMQGQLNHQHSLRGVPFTPVPRLDGTPPPSWPAAGFDRAALVEGPIAAVDALLGDYGIPAGAGVGAPVVRRIALAQALGTASV